MPNPSRAEHPFATHPHRAFLRLSLPVLISLTAEPITGLIDTAFVARLGEPSLAGLGIATSLLAGIFWVFNFLSIGTQTQVANAFGIEDESAIARSAGTAVTCSAVLGFGLLFAFLPFIDELCMLFGADAEVLAESTTYLCIRLIGAPAILVAHAVSGAFRGLQDMRTPLIIAILSNSINIALDSVMIHGAGPIPALGITGAAWASVIGQLVAMIAAIGWFQHRHGLLRPRKIADIYALFTIGRDLVVRTGSLLLFLMYATRVANLISVETGAAHQAIRSIWIFAAFLLDAYATTAQSLVGYFIGLGDVPRALRAARIACLWGLVTGIATTAVMLAGSNSVSLFLIGTPATTTFHAAWLVAAIAQPINAISFVTDGIHWGSHDYRYLRNAMLAASGAGIAALAVLEQTPHATLQQIWIVTALWITIRAMFGLLRIWPRTSGPLKPSK